MEKDIKKALRFKELAYLYADKVCEYLITNSYKTKNKDNSIAIAGLIKVTRNTIDAVDLKKVEPEDVIGDLTLRKLNEIFQSVMKKQRDKVDPNRSKFHKIEKEEVRVEEKILSIRKQLIGLKNINFKTLLESQPSKTQVVVTFLAVLELMKMGLLRVRQEEIHGDIWMDSEEEGSVTEYGDQ